METRMDSRSDVATATLKLMGRTALAVAVLVPVFLLGGCMTPEDKAFYGRGWINPSELDQEPPPRQNLQDPTAVSPHMMGPGYY
jgi:hypothetical protein